MSPVVAAFASAQSAIDSSSVSSFTSDRVLEHVRIGLESLGFEVESGKRSDQKVRRPVLFGTQGSERVAYEIDGFHDGYGIVLEVEAGRGARSNAVYRDLIRTSLIVDARYLVIDVMSEYRHQSGTRSTIVRNYKETADLLDATYASGRLQFPFEGILLVGY
ncbi:MAG: hypothetical protein DWG80_03075 [Chloroflexi bacterium]|nr:hypothetical protein [Chloroflexota bacterium]